GTRLAFCTIFDAYPAEIIVDEWKDGKWTAARIPRRFDHHIRGYGSPLKWVLHPTSAGRSEDALVYLGEVKGFVDVFSHHPVERASGILGYIPLSAVCYGF